MGACVFVYVHACICMCVFACVCVCTYVCMWSKALMIIQLHFPDQCEVKVLAHQNISLASHCRSLRLGDEMRFSSSPGKFPLFKRLPFAVLIWKGKYSRKRKLRNIRCMFLRITANKLSPKQTGRHSRALLNKRQGPGAEKPPPPPSRMLEQKRSPFLLLSLPYTSIWLGSKDKTSWDTSRSAQLKAAHP